MQRLPEARLGDHARERRLCAVDRARQAAEKPLHPRRDVHRALLRLFEDAVVVAPLLPDLRRHAVEPLRAALRSRQRHIGNRPRDPSVAVVERMDRDEPEMAPAQPSTPARWSTSPLNHSRKRRISSSRRAAAGASKCTRSRPTGPDTTCIGPVRSSRHAPTVIRVHPAAPVGNSDACHANSRSAVSGCVVLLRRVEHHLDHAFDVAIDGRQAADVHAEAPRDGRADLLGIERLAFDLAAFQDVVGQGVENRLRRTLKPSASIWPIRRPCWCRAAESGDAKRFVIPDEPWPVWKLMDIVVILRSSCGDYSLIAAQNAAIVSHILRNMPGLAHASARRCVTSASFGEGERWLTASERRNRGGRYRPLSAGRRRP